ncbi:MAG: hypothetical protein GWP64_09965 [Gammaproteobacteria bacterium]|nr:hypothetical protein [Gammaproteobacteria bacterium]
MRKLMTAVLAVFAIGVSGIASADNFANVYTCKLKDDVEMEAVQAANSKWLKFVNSKVEGGGITSSIGTAVVGDNEVFIFVDTYPSLSAWAAAAELLDSDAADEIDGLFEDLNDCSKNSLWKFEDTK